MRRVEVSKIVYTADGCSQKKPVYRGQFHGWGMDYEEFESGPGNHTAAIIEGPDGTIELVYPSLVCFLDSPPCGKECDHGSPCQLSTGHTPSDRHETAHGCVFFDPHPPKADKPAEGYFDIVFDGPPGAVPGRFVEVENEQRASISVGEWVHRDDGYWVLRIPR